MGGRLFAYSSGNDVSPKTRHTDEWTRRPGVFKCLLKPRENMADRTEFVHVKFQLVKASGFRVMAN